MQVMQKSSFIRTSRMVVVKKLPPFVPKRRVIPFLPKKRGHNAVYCGGHDACSDSLRFAAAGGMLDTCEPAASPLPMRSTSTDYPQGTAGGDAMQLYDPYKFSTISVGHTTHASDLPRVPVPISLSCG